MTKEDIALIMKGIDLGNGEDIVERVQALGERIAEANDAYSIASEKNSEHAKYIETARQSRAFQEASELAVAREFSNKDYIAKLQRFADELVGEQVVFVLGQTIPEQVSNMLAAMLQDKHTALSLAVEDIRARYRISQAVKPDKQTTESIKD